MSAHDVHLIASTLRVLTVKAGGGALATRERRDALEALARLHPEVPGLLDRPAIVGKVTATFNDSEALQSMTDARAEDVETVSEALQFLLPLRQTLAASALMALARLCDTSAVYEVKEGKPST